MKVNTVYNKDSIKGLSEVESESVHSIISDIPYGIGYTDWDVLHSNTNSAFGGESSAQKKNSLFKRRGKPLNGWSEADKNIGKEYEEWCNKWSPEWYRVVKPGSSVFIFAGRQMSHRVISSMENSGFTFKDMLSWERDRAPHRAQRISKVFERRKDFDSANEWADWRVANLRPLFEPILWFQKPYKLGSTLADNVKANNVGAWNEKALKNWNCFTGTKQQSNMLKVEVTQKDREYHPTQKPLDLMKLLIELVTIKNQLVLDPFCGSGTTLVAAKNLSRRFIGYEIDDDYCSIAKQRLKLTKSL